LNNDLYLLEIRTVIEDIHANKAGAKQYISFQTWHARFGHLNQQYLTEMITKESVIGLSVQNGKREIEFCKGCLQGKQTRKSFKSSSTKRANCPGQLVHVDLCHLEWKSLHQEEIVTCSYIKMTIQT
jgi:predicted metal-dependent TIM-barrel fold hydrolase